MRRHILHLAGALAATLALVACGTSTAPPAPHDTTTPPSDGAQLILQVPTGWLDKTNEVAEQIQFPGATFEAAWVIEGTLFVDASSVLVVSYAGLSDADRLRETSFSTAIDTYAPATTETSTHQTSTGLVFDRQDITGTLEDGRDFYEVELTTVVGDTGYEIAISLFGDAIGRLDEVLNALDTLVL